MYRVLYRKWRPKTLSDVAGQPHVTVTLKNELKSGRINHAYLFTGSRGTGKTTCAKILAKAVNCLTPEDGDPCCVCENCTGIENGNILDVLEIDAASNNGVDNIRELREEAVFSPASAKYRVYIIDEVHMLSQGAFNALLKTLEEPPKHVIFILATTEVHKLPETILSRCQRFDFRRIPPADIAARLKYVAQQENVEATDEALMLVAAVSDGALRDALSLFDRCIGISESITAETVAQAAGLAGSGRLFDLSESIIEKDISAAVAITDSLYRESKDMSRLCDELTRHFRDLLYILTVKNPREFLVMSDLEFQKADLLAKKCGTKRIIAIIDILLSSCERMGKGSDAKIELEVTLFKLCADQNKSDESHIKRLNELEMLVKKILSGQSVSARNPLSREPEDEIPGHEKSVSGQKPCVEAAVPQSPSDESPALSAPVDFNRIIEDAIPFTRWHEVLDILKKYSRTIAASFDGTSAYESGEYLLIDVPEGNELPFKLLRQSAQRDKMRTAVMEITGRQFKLGPYKKQPEKEQKSDPLDDFAAGLKDMGIEIEEE